MGPVINLRTERKRAKRRLSEEEAARNRLAHGRAKTERALQRSQNELARKNLDQHRIEKERGP